MSVPELKALTSDNKPRCLAVTKAGKQCTRAAEAGSNYCWQHQPKKEDEKDTHVQYSVLSQNPLVLGLPVLHLKDSTKFTREDNKELIKLVQSQVHPDIKLNAEALEFINDLTYPLYLFFDEANGSAPSDTKDSLIALVKDAYPGELAKHAISEINRNHGSIKNNINTIPVEYIIAELTELAGNSARGNHKLTTTYYDVNSAIYQDFELRELFKNNKASSTDLFFSHNPKIYDVLGKKKKITRTINIKVIKPNGVIFSSSQIDLKTSLVNYLINTYFSYQEDQVISIGYTSPMDYFSDYVRTYKTELNQFKSWKSMIEFLMTHDLIRQKLDKYCSNVTNIMEENIIRQVCENIVTQYL